MFSTPVRRTWVTNSFFLVLVLLQRECLSFFALPVQQQRSHAAIGSLSSSSSLLEQLSVSAINRKWRRHQKEGRLYSVIMHLVLYLLLLCSSIFMNSNFSRDTVAVTLVVTRRCQGWALPQSNHRFQGCTL